MSPVRRRVPVHSSVIAGLTVVATMVACGARTDVPSPSSESQAVAPPSTAPADQPTQAPADEPTPYEAPQDACMTDSASTRAYSSAADLNSLLVGRWMMCNPGTPNAYWSAEGVGLDLLADGLCYPLYRRNGTEIIRGGGDYVWRYSAVPGQGALFDMVFEGGGNPTFASQLGDDPRKLVMDDGKKKYVFAPAQ
jgi:hypothetical protein